MQRQSAQRPRGWRASRCIQHQCDTRISKETKRMTINLSVPAALFAHPEIQMIAFDALRIDNVNVRNIGRGADPELAASIKAMGIQTPLIARKNCEGYLVIEGGQRLEAVRSLRDAGDWPADQPLPVIVTDKSDAEAREISLALNLMRKNMHPVDAFRAFTLLHTDKEKPFDVEAIASRFGTDVRTVRQRLALGALDDVILNAWVAGEINEPTVQAFTLTPDKSEQVRIFQKLKETGLHVHAVKQELKIDGTGRM